MNRREFIEKCERMGGSAPRGFAFTITAYPNQGLAHISLWSAAGSKGTLLAHSLVDVDELERLVKMFSETIDELVV